MTGVQISALGPAFSAYLKPFRDDFAQERSVEHFDAFCMGLLGDLPRKSVEPIALACGTAVRTMQAFLATSTWDHDASRDRFQRQMAKVVQEMPRDSLGVIGVIDETSAAKKGDKTPGVQRQYLGCVGKIDNGIVTVHIAVATGSFRGLLDADLFLPKSWDDDRDRCRRAGIPDEIVHRTKWRIALDQVIRLHRNGHRFDWLTFDEGYGRAVPFLEILSFLGQKFVAEVPKNFAVRTSDNAMSQRADELLSELAAKGGERFRLRRETHADQFWRAKKRRVRVGGRSLTLIVAINEATGEVKYFVTNANDTALSVILEVAFRRWTVEHLFRVAKQEVGFAHFEGRHYVGLMRHMILCVLVLGFVSIQTDRLRGEKPTRDDGASLSGAERDLRFADDSSPSSSATRARRGRGPLSSTAKRASIVFAQKAAA